MSFVDFGDLGEFPPGPEGYRYLWDSLSALFDKNKGKKWIFLGGDHSITFPIVSLLSGSYPDLFVVYVDAHLDLRDSYLGEKNSHASTLRRIVEKLGVKSVVHVFGRSGDKEEFDFLRDSGMAFVSGDVCASLEKALFLSRGRPVYVTVDLDVFDPSFFPGTGTPEPGGISPAEFFKAFPIFSFYNVVGVDVVELNPLLDPSGSSSLLASKIVREFILLLGKGH